MNLTRHRVYAVVVASWLVTIVLMVLLGPDLGAVIQLIAGAWLGAFSAVLMVAAQALPKNPPRKAPR